MEMPGEVGGRLAGQVGTWTGLGLGEVNAESASRIWEQSSDTVSL
jgi:hypothetical protein